MFIGEKIKGLRTKQGITQEELAIAVGTKKQTIHKYETGIISNIPASKIKAIADKLGTTPAYLMGWEENEKLPESNDELVEMIRQQNKTRGTAFFCGADGKVIDVPPEAERLILNLIETLDKNKK